MPITADPSWPGIEPNVRVMTESLGKALVGVVVQNWPAVVEGFFSALGGGFQQGEPSLEQQVGRWWRTAGYMALTTCLQDAHWGLVLSDEECKTGALERIEALLHKDSLSLDAEGWQDPAYSAFGQVLAQDFPHFLTELHTDTRLNTDQQQAMLRDAFYRAARWLQVHEPALCQAIEAQLFSQQAQAEQLRQSMARHRRWIDQLFFHEPVFGEKGEGRNGTPLAQLYVAPRGYRRAEIEREERRDDAPPPAL